MDEPITLSSRLPASPRSPPKIWWNGRYIDLESEVREPAREDGSPRASPVRDPPKSPTKIWWNGRYIDLESEAREPALEDGSPRASPVRDLKEVTKNYNRLRRACVRAGKPYEPNYHEIANIPSTQPLSGKVKRHIDGLHQAEQLKQSNVRRSARVSEQFKVVLHHNEDPPPQISFGRPHMNP